MTIKEFLNKNGPYELTHPREYYYGVLGVLQLFARYPLKGKYEMLAMERLLKESPQDGALFLDGALEGLAALREADPIALLALVVEAGKFDDAELQQAWRQLRQRLVQVA